MNTITYEESVVRLTKLVDLLQNFDNNLEIIDHGVKSFDLQGWYWPDNLKAKVCDKKTTQRGKIVSCGTTACAAGSAALHPWFNERGLYLINQADGDEEPEWTIQYGKKTAFQAAGAFFGIDYSESIYIFSPSSYTSDEVQNPHVVAARIKAMLRGMQTYRELYAKKETEKPQDTLLQQVGRVLIIREDGGDLVDTTKPINAGRYEYGTVTSYYGSVNKNTIEGAFDIAKQNSKETGKQFSVALCIGQTEETTVTETVQKKTWDIKPIKL